MSEIVVQTLTLSPLPRNFVKFPNLPTEISVGRCGFNSSTNLTVAMFQQFNQSNDRSCIHSSASIDQRSSSHHPAAPIELPRSSRPSILHRSLLKFGLQSSSWFWLSNSLTSPLCVVVDPAFILLPRSLVSGRPTIFIDPPSGTHPSAPIHRAPSISYVDHRSIHRSCIDLPLPHPALCLLPTANRHTSTPSAPFQFPGFPVPVCRDECVTLTASEAGLAGRSNPEATPSWTATASATSAFIC
jgi:hypothetical protein